MQFLIIIFIIIIFMSGIIDKASKDSKTNNSELKRLIEDRKKSRDEINLGNKRPLNKLQVNLPDVKQVNKDENEYFSLEETGIKEAEERQILTVEEIDKNINEEDYSLENDAEGLVIKDNSSDKNETKDSMDELDIFNFSRNDLIKTVIMNELISKPKCKRDE